MSFKTVRGLFLAFLFFSIPAFAAIPAGYAGKPCKGTPLAIPGRFMVTDLDTGTGTFYNLGEGVTGMFKAEGLMYYDCIVPGYESEVVFTPGQKYWAWIGPGEWMKVTINVAAAGSYAINLQGAIGHEDVRLRVVVYDGADSVCSDTLHPEMKKGTCDPWHSWYVVKSIDTLTLKAGLQVMKWQAVTNGPYNLMWLELKSLSSAAQPASLHSAKPDDLYIQNAAHTGGEVTVQFKTSATSASVVSLYDPRGKLLESKTVSRVKNGINSVAMKCPFSTGVFLVRVNQAGKTTQGKLLIGK